MAPKPTSKTFTKVVFKPDSQSTDEYVVIVNPAEFKKWKDGDTSVPLVEVVDSFTVFHSGQGSQGLLGQPSKQQLDTVFNTHKDVDVVEHILKHGREQGSEGISNLMSNTNVSRGSVSDARVKQGAIRN